MTTRTPESSQQAMVGVVPSRNGSGGIEKWVGRRRDFFKAEKGVERSTPFFKSLLFL